MLPSSEDGAQVRILDIENSAGRRVRDAFQGCDTVIFAAGGGPDGNIERKRTVDLEGALKSIEAARARGIDRLIQVSAINVDAPPPEDASPVWRAYVEAKRDADIALRDSDLAWTIVRPGRLTDDEPTGLVDLGRDVERGDVTRADVAAVVAALVDIPASAGKQWNLVNGRTSILEAISAEV